MSFSQIPWLLLCSGLTVLGLIGSWIALRRRGTRAALRGVAWSLLPIAAYLIGILQVLWRFGVAVGDFFGGIAFSPKVWSGVIIAAIALVLFVVTGGLRSRSRKRASEKQDETAGRSELTASSAAATSARTQPVAVPAKRKAAAAAPDDDFADVAQILRKHGIS